MIRDITIGQYYPADSRIHKLETDGIISGYTVTLNRPADRMYVDALISLSVAPSKQDAFLELLQNSGD